MKMFVQYGEYIVGSTGLKKDKNSSLEEPAVVFKPLETAWSHGHLLNSSDTVTS